MLGPMSYGAAFCAVTYKPALARQAYADSKTLTEEKRDKLFEQMKKDAQLGWLVDVISAEALSTKMLRKERYNLNAISYDSAFGLIQAALDAGVNVCEVVVDTVGDAEQYTQRLNARFPGIRCLAAAKADRDHPIVSAASIAAKVTRDNELRDFAFEPGLTGDAAPGREWGCGYPGDAATVAWLSQHLQPVFGYPSLVRFSWATTKRLLEGPTAVPVRWEADAEDEAAAGPSTAKAGRLPFGAMPSHLAASSGAGRHAYLRSRKLARVIAF